MTKNLQWFRLYHRIVDDEKIRMLAFEDRWHFIALCCLKASGLLDEPDSQKRDRRIAVKLGVQLRELDEIKRRLFEEDLIDENMCPAAWDTLQYKTDTSTDRVRKHRKKAKKNNDETQRNVSVTPPETDTESETDTSSLRSEVRERKRGPNPIVVLHSVVDPVLSQKWVQHCEDKGRRLSVAQAEALVVTLQEVVSQGGNAADALRIAIRKGWTSFEVEWLRNAGLKFSSAPTPKETDWLNWCRVFFKGRHWANGLGPDPDDPACEAPPEIIAQARREIQSEQAA